MFNQNKRSLETFLGHQEEINEIKNKLRKYEDNKIALRKKALSDLYSKKYELEKLLKETCPHDMTSVVSGQWTDEDDYGSYISGHEHNIFCDRCKEYMLDRGRTPDRFSTKTPQAPLIESARLYVEKYHLDDDELRKFGLMKRVTKTIEYIEV